MALIILMVMWTTSINLSQDALNTGFGECICFSARVGKSLKLYSKIFLSVYILLLTRGTNANSFSQEYDCIEFYAGKANLTKMMKLAGYRAAKLDFLYGVRPSGKQHQTNPMDLLSPSGFGLLGS